MQNTHDFIFNAIGLYHQSIMNSVQNGSILWKYPWEKYRVVTATRGSYRVWYYHLLEEHQAPLTSAPIIQPSYLSIRTCTCTISELSESSLNPKKPNPPPSLSPRGGPLWTTSLHGRVRPSLWLWWNYSRQSVQLWDCRMQSQKTRQEDLNRESRCMRRNHRRWLRQNLYPGIRPHLRFGGHDSF